MQPGNQPYGGTSLSRMFLTPFNNMINEVQRKIGKRKRKKEKNRIKDKHIKKQRHNICF